LLARRLSWDLQTPAPPLKSGSAAERSGSKVPVSAVEPRVGGGQKIKCMSVSEAGAEPEVIGSSERERSGERESRKWRSELSG